MEFIDIKHDFFFVSYGRSIITNDSFELLKQTIAKLSEKFGFILWDHPDILTEAEGIDFTKHCLGSKHLKGIIFALDEDIYDDTDIALKIALDYCVNKDIEYYQKKRK